MPKVQVRWYVRPNPEGQKNIKPSIRPKKTVKPKITIGAHTRVQSYLLCTKLRRADATILPARVNIKILLHHVDLFYIGVDSIRLYSIRVDSIRLYMLRYYSIYDLI